MPAPDFVVVGHATRDLGPNGWVLGGTVTFAAVQAHRLGRRTGIVTAAEREVVDRVRLELPFAELAAAETAVSTAFENRYERGRRSQFIRAQGPRIESSTVPDDWRAAPIVLLGPVWGELAPGFAAVFDRPSLVGVSAQGWLRAADADGRVLHAAWDGAPFWQASDVVFVSDEDLEDGGERELSRWTESVRIVAMTQASRGAEIWSDGAWRSIDAFPTREVDPTGAGDTFATGFLIRLHETGDVAEAARFGAAAASLSVGGIGAAAMPGRAEVEERMRQHPDVALR